MSPRLIWQVWCGESVSLGKPAATLEAPRCLVRLKNLFSFKRLPTKSESERAAVDGSLLLLRSQRPLERFTLLARSRKGPKR